TAVRVVGDVHLEPTAVGGGGDTASGDVGRARRAREEDGVLRSEGMEVAPDHPDAESRPCLVGLEGLDLRQPARLAAAAPRASGTAGAPVSTPGAAGPRTIATASAGPGPSSGTTAGGIVRFTTRSQDREGAKHQENTCR